MTVARTTGCAAALLLLAGCAASDHIIAPELTATPNTVITRTGEGVFVSGYWFRAPYRFENKTDALDCLGRQVKAQGGEVSDIDAGNNELQMGVVLPVSEMTLATRLHFQHSNTEGNYYYFEKPRLGSNHDEWISASSEHPALDVRDGLKALTDNIQACLPSAGTQ